MRLSLWNIEFCVGKGLAGFIYLGVGERFCIHALVGKEFRQWGYAPSWHDGPMHIFGLGPWFLLVIYG